jgi:simple sugar transport system permease protein
VIGGTLVTSGYGTVIGAALGAIIFGWSSKDSSFAGGESSLFRVFLGVILFVAVILNI